MMIDQRDVKSGETLLEAIAVLAADRFR